MPRKKWHSPSGISAISSEELEELRQRLKAAGFWSLEWNGFEQYWMLRRFYPLPDDYPYPGVQIVTLKTPDIRMIRDRDIADLIRDFDNFNRRSDNAIGNPGNSANKPVAA